METQDLYASLIGMLFPTDITEHFRIVHIESLPAVMVVHFEEKDEFHGQNRAMNTIVTVFTKLQHTIFSVHCRNNVRKF